jgi:hypothetical protein
MFEALFLSIRSKCAGLDLEARELEKAYEYLKIFRRKAGFKPGQPRIPTGNPGGGEWSNSPSATPHFIQEHWSRPETLSKHVLEHGKDFGVTNAHEYVKKSERVSFEVQKREAACCHR